MLGTIIKKEILNNILSLRFLTAFVLLLTIVPVTAFVLTDDYIRKLDEYSARQNSLDHYLRTYAHFNRVGNILAPSQPPLPLNALIRGLSPDDINLETTFGEFNTDSLSLMFPLIDLTFIVTILVSLIALVFAYDSVCGEKEDGTLKLMLTGALSRSKIIIGKIAGGTLTLLIPFVISLLAALLVLMLNPRVSWTGADWGAVALILFGAVLYFMFFYLLGVLISANHSWSAASIMTSLFAWVLIVLVIPNLSPYVASFVAPTPSQIKVGREVSRLTSEDRDVLGRKLADEKRLEIQRLYPVLAERLSETELKERLAGDPDYRKAYDALIAAVSAAWYEANRIQSEKASVISGDLETKQRAQTRASVIVSAASPLADFLYLSRELSSTGIGNIAYFSRLSDIWESSFLDYRTRKLAELQKQNPAVDWWNTPVDMSDKPVFRYKEEALGSRVRRVLPFFAVLLVFNLILFSAAYVAFTRYDVR